MPADCPLARDLIPRLRADRDQVEREMPVWFVRSELWLEDLRAFKMPSTARFPKLRLIKNRGPYE